MKNLLIGFIIILSLNNAQFKETITVGAFGCDYKTINEAVFVARDSPDNPVRILIMPGAYIESVDISGRYISLVGVNKHLCVIKNYYNDYSKTPVNISGSNNTVKNLTIVSAQDKNTPIRSGSYGIHCDSVGQGAGKSLIENCIIKSVQNAGIGLGTNNQQEITIKDCEIISDNTRALYAHNYQLSGSSGQKLNVIDCKITSCSNEPAIILQDANHRSEGRFIGGYDDQRDSVFTFINNMVKSSVAGFGGDAPLDSESLSGYIRLGQGSRGNNVREININ